MLNNSEHKTKRDEVIERIRKLSKYTVENGASENEVAKAAAAISKLIGEYNIGEDEISLKEEADHLATETYIDLRGGRTPWIDCLSLTARLFTCRVWCQNDTEDDPIMGYHRVLKVHFFGYRADCIAAVNLTAIIHNAILAEGMRFMPYKGKRRTAAQEISLASFETGMTGRINERLRDMQPPPIESKGRDLIPLKNQLVTDAWARERQRLGLVAGHSAAVQGDGHALRAGRLAGDKVDLGNRGRVAHATATPRLK